MKTKKTQRQWKQPDLWNNLPVNKKTKKKFSIFDAERELIVRMLNEAKQKKEGEK